MANITISDINLSEILSDLNETESSQIVGGTCWWREGEFLGCNNDGIDQVIFTDSTNEIIAIIPVDVE